MMSLSSFHPDMRDSVRKIREEGTKAAEGLSTRVNLLASVHGLNVSLKDSSLSAGTYTFHGYFRNVLYDPATHLLIISYFYYMCKEMLEIVNMKTGTIVFKEDMKQSSAPCIEVVDKTLYYFSNVLVCIDLTDPTLTMTSPEVDHTLLRGGTARALRIMTVRLLAPGVWYTTSVGGWSSVLRWNKDQAPEVIKSFGEKRLGEVGVANVVLSPCGKFLIWCEVNTIKIHYVVSGFTEDAPLFTVDGMVESLKFSEDGISVVAVPKDGSKVKTVPLPLV